VASEIIIRLDVMLALRKRKAKDLAAEIGMTEANLSLLKSGKVKGIRFDTLVKLCDALDCDPGDLIDIGKVSAD
jgi:putative transcriptional regulator